MRTLLFLVVGFLLLGACLPLGRLFSGHYAGAAHATTLADELPIFLLIFRVPAAVAVFLRWKFP